MIMPFEMEDIMIFEVKKRISWHIYKNTFLVKFLLKILYLVDLASSSTNYITFSLTADILKISIKLRKLNEKLMACTKYIIFKYEDIKSV